MTKMIKMSLVAAVAVAGLTSTASAVSLEEAVKGSTLTGYARYRLNKDYENKTDVNEETKAVFNFGMPVNDMVKANIRMSAEALTANYQAGTSTTSTNSQIEKGENTTKAEMNIVEAKFTVNVAGASVIAGLQNTPSPFFDGGDDRSHGVTALVPVGKDLTVAGGYYFTTVGGVNTASNAMALGLIGKAGPVNFEGWYASTEDTTSVFAEDDNAIVAGIDSAIYLNAGADIAGWNVSATMASKEASAAGSKKQEQSRLVVSGKVANVNLLAAYATSGTDGGAVTISGDTDAKADFQVEEIAVSAASDVAAFVVGASMNLTDTVSAGITHLNGDAVDGTVDLAETKIEATYQMSKNFGITAWYTTGEAGYDFTNSRIEVLYKF